jgi:hypothetical protein
MTITGRYYSLLLPKKIIRPFLDNNQKKVKAIASYGTKEISYYRTIQKRGAHHYMMFRKRYQKELDIFPNAYFKLQFFENTSKYGLQILEELDAVVLRDVDAYEIFECLIGGKKSSIIYAISRYKLTQTKINKSFVLYENLKRGIGDNRVLFKSF